MLEQNLEFDNPIFKFISPFSDDQLSKLSPNELKEFLNLLNNYYLELRDTLNISKKITFGLEIKIDETNSDMYHTLYNLDVKKKWNVIGEDTLPEGDEIVSPILTDKVQTWKDLRTICNIISANGIISPNCGGHIHIGTQTLGRNVQSWGNFINLWAGYENVIFRFAYGEYLGERNLLKIIVSPVAEYFFKYQDKIIHNLFSSRKCGAVSLSYVKSFEKMKNNTIEFRCPNGTLEPVIWQNNINFFIKMLLYCKSKTFDFDTIEKRKNLKEDLESYRQIFLDQALELADLIFDNNLDKIYFLRQYLKTFEVSDKFFVKAKRFVK